jgi:DNA-binding NarL/FixJ family response regulator
MTVNHIAPRTAMIVAPVGIWRDALVSLMRAQSNLLIAAVVDSLSAAQGLLLTTAIDVIVLDCGVDGANLSDFLRWLGVEYPSVRSVVAVDTQIQQPYYLAIGAHATLQKGRLDDALLRVIVADGG